MDTLLKINFILLKISKLANAQTMDIFRATFIDFFNVSSPMPKEKILKY
ncbi:hypothetical protein [Capnocytophaga felis]|nr:hypothetical protein [Capnocytophaga felis]